MPAVVIDNTAQVRIVWSKAGEPFAVNVLHGVKDFPLEAVDQADVDNLAAALATRVGATSYSQISNQIKISQVGIRDLDTPNNPEFIKGVAANVGGSGTAELLPLNVAACVTLRTNRAGASYRGRTYLTGWTEGASASGVMNQITADQAVLMVTAFKNAMKDAGFTMSIASRKLGTSEPVTSIVSRDLTWDTQRRRIVPGI